MVWRTCPNSQHEIHSLAEVIKDVSGCAIEGRFIGIPPHDGVDLAEGEWRLCTTRCSPPRTSVVCRASSSTPTSNRTIHHVRERPLLLCGVGGLVGVYSRPVIGALFCPLSGFRYCFFFLSLSKDFKVWVVTPNLPTHLIIFCNFEKAHRVWTHNGSFFTFARWNFLKLSWKLNDNPPDVF